MTEIYTIKDRWGYWWSSAASPEEGYLLHKPGEGAVTIKLRTLDHIIQNYGISAGAPIQEVIEDDEIITTWADDVIRASKAAPKPKPILATIERGEDPSLLDPEAELETTLDLVLSERKRSEQLGHLRYFALRLWDVAEAAGADDISKCCGCTGSDEELNPFKEKK